MTAPKDRRQSAAALRAEFFYALEALAGAAQRMSSMLLRIAEVDEDFGLDVETMEPIVEAIDELARRVAELRK